MVLLSLYRLYFISILMLHSNELLKPTAGVNLEDAIQRPLPLITYEYEACVIMMIYNTYNFFYDTLIFF